MRIIYIFTSLAVILLTFGCAGVQKTTKTTTLSSTNSDMQILVQEGMEFEIPVNSVPSSGFKWMVSKIDEKRISFVESRYPEPKAPAENQGFMVNNTVDENMVFKALKTGTTTLELKYVQPFNPDDPEAEIQTYQITIE